MPSGHAANVVVATARGSLLRGIGPRSRARRSSPPPTGRGGGGGARRADGRAVPIVPSKLTCSREAVALAGTVYQGIVDTLLGACPDASGLAASTTRKRGRPRRLGRFWDVRADRFLEHIIPPTRVRPSHRDQLGIRRTASSTRYRTQRQNDGRRLPNLSAERHVRVRSRSARTLGVGQYAGRSKAVGDAVVAS